MAQSEISFDYKIHLSPVNVQSKQKSQRDIKITKNVLIPPHAFCHAARTLLATMNGMLVVYTVSLKLPHFLNSNLANVADMFVNETNYIFYP